MSNFSKIKFWLIFLLFSTLTFVSCVHIKTFIPQGGQVGSEIEIIGSGFSTDINGNQVTFGSIAAEVLSASGDQLIVRVPYGVSRAKIKVSCGWLNDDESTNEFIPLPNYVEYNKFSSPTLSTTSLESISRCYWIMYPTGFDENGRKFPIIYALHGYNFDRYILKTGVGELLKELSFLNINTNDEFSWL